MSHVLREIQLESIKEISKGRRFRNTNLLVLQECLTHAVAEVQLCLQLIHLLLPVA